MVCRDVMILNKTGLHLKPAACLSQEASKYLSVITFTFGNTTANAKSILSVLGACVRKGDIIELICSGEDEEIAMERICNVINEGLGDEIE